VVDYGQRAYDSGGRVQPLLALLLGHGGLPMRSVTAKLPNLGKSPKVGMLSFASACSHAETSAMRWCRVRSGWAARGEKKEKQGRNGPSGSGFLESHHESMDRKIAFDRFVLQERGIPRPTGRASLHPSHPDSPFTLSSRTPAPP
jgi:hypothetical protein